MASKKPDLLANVQRITANNASADAGGERQPSIDYPISTQAPAGEPELPAQAGLLSEQLQGIARRYIGARRRSGEALLEAARWLSEARALAEHGQWQIFLEATSTSDDTAERLLNIHRQAMQNPQFAESVRTSWINQSVAALLARPSTAPEVVAEVLSSPEPPTVAEVQEKIRQKPTSRQNPQVADSGEALSQPRAPTPGGGQNPQVADSGETLSQSEADRSLQMLQKAATLVRELVSIADAIPAGDLAEQAVADIERGVATIRQILAQHT